MTDWMQLLQIGSNVASGVSQGKSVQGAAFDVALGVGAQIATPAVAAAITAACPFLAPIALPLAGMLTGAVSKLVKSVFGLFGKKSRAPEKYTNTDKPYLAMMYGLGKTTPNGSKDFNYLAGLLDRYDQAIAEDRDTTQLRDEIETIFKIKNQSNKTPPFFNY